MDNIRWYFGTIVFEVGNALGGIGGWLMDRGNDIRERIFEDDPDTLTAISIEARQNARRRLIATLRDEHNWDGADPRD